MTGLPRSVRVFPALLIAFVASYFISKGLLNGLFFLVSLPPLLLLLAPQIHQKISARLSRRLLLLLALSLLSLLLTQILSLWFSPYSNQLHARLVLKELRVGLVFIAPLGIALCYSLSNPKQRLWLLYAFVLGMLFLGALGTLQWLSLTIDVPLNFFRFRFDVTDRSYGFQRMPILFAYQIFPLIPLLCGLLWYKDGPLYQKAVSSRWRLVALFALVLIFIALIGSGNRACLLVLLPVLPLLLLRGHSRLVLPAYAGTFLIGLLLLLFSPAGQRLQDLFRSYEPSGHMRLTLWSSHWRGFLEHPWIGVGRGVNSRSFYIDTLGPQLWNLDSVSSWAHNMYLDLLSSSGVLGFLSFSICAGALPLTVSLRLFRKKEFHLPTSGVAFSLLLSTVAWFGGAFFENSLDVNHNRILLSTLLSGWWILAQEA